MHHFSSMESGLIEHLIPLGDSILEGFLAVLASLTTYAIGRSKRRAEIDNLRAEKKSIEAASGVSTAEAAQVIADAAAATLKPLMERLREQREEIRFLMDNSAKYRAEIEDIRTKMARVQAENELMRRKFSLQGEVIPQLPEEK